jgi:hypothetical protein
MGLKIARAGTLPEKPALQQTDGTERASAVLAPQMVEQQSRKDE